MKLKKEIVTLLLASTLLAAPLTACNTLQNGGNDIDNSTTEITTIETTPETKPNEVIRDVPKLGKLKLVPYSDLKKASIWRGENGEFFLYINEWDAYRELSGLISYYDWLYFTDNCIVIDSETATIALINQDGKHDEPTIITYHFNKDNALVELHAVPLNIIASSEYDTFFVNMHTADHGYYFLTPTMDGSQDWRMDGVQGWPLFMFETTDGGKSWNQISTNTFTFCTSDHINIIKFVSPNVGIISFRYVNLEDLCERTYLTLDGGLTWNQISQLPYPSNEGWGYSEVVDMALIDDRYYLTVKISDNTQGELQFWSKDLTNWTLVE
jgi:predicted small secreted protein